MAWARAEAAACCRICNRVRLAVSGAAPLPIEALERFRALFGVDIYEANRSQSPLQWLEDEGQNRP